MIIIEDTLPIEVVNILNSPEFDDEASIVIDSLTFTEDNLKLNFSFRYYDDTPSQYWQLTVSEYKKERITREWTQHIELYRQHPLLLPYTDTHTALYFRGTTTQYQELFTDIYRSLLTLTEEVTELEEYIFTPKRVEELSQQGYGLFASGSKTILMLYHQCLTKYGIHAYFVGEGKPSGADRGLKLFQLGSSYIIGKDFVFGRI